MTACNRYERQEEYHKKMLSPGNERQLLRMPKIFDEVSIYGGKECA
jgi:hypothetical protein